MTHPEFCSTRIVLRTPYPSESDTPVGTQKPWEWVSTFLFWLIRNGHVRAVRELEKKWFSSGLVDKPIDVPLSEQANVVTMARRAVKSGTVFFTLDLPVEVVETLLVEIGYEKVLPQSPNCDGHVFGDIKGFADAIASMLRSSGGGTACCFSHDGERVYLFAEVNRVQAPIP